MNRIKAVILKNELQDDHLPWIKACKKYSEYIEYFTLDFLKDDCINEIKLINPDVCLAKPSILSSEYKKYYDERIYVINNILKIPVYPSATEIYIYENKRLFYSWLKAKKLPHPETHIFYDVSEAISFIANAQYPLVTKTQIGASGSGVKIFKNKKDLTIYIKNAISGRGVSRRWGPDIFADGIVKRIFNYLIKPSKISNKFHVYKVRKSDVQKGFVIIQKFIPHDYEWRVVFIGGSFFAHKKLKKGEKASGSLIKNYDNPPVQLFNYARNIVNENEFTSVAIDLFEDVNGNFLVNEIQCIFGQSDPYQMLVNGKPGRYIYNNEWIFEGGDFNTNESYDLRICHVLSLYGGKEVNINYNII